MNFKNLEELFSRKSKFIERDKGIFLDRLISGHDFRLISKKYNTSLERTKQIYNRTLFRLSYPLIDRIHKENMNDSWESIIDLKNQIDLIQSQYTGETQIKNYWKEIEKLKIYLEVFIKKFEEKYHQYSQPYNQIEERFTRVLELFDKKIYLINERIDIIARNQKKNNK